MDHAAKGRTNADAVVGDADGKEAMMDYDRELECDNGCGTVPHRFAPSPDAGPHWRCSECGEISAGSAPRAHDIVNRWLSANGFDGLYNAGNCACEVGHLAPCLDDIGEDCRPGYKVPGCNSHCGAGCDWHIAAGKDSRRSPGGGKENMDHSPPEGNSESLGTIPGQPSAARSRR